MSDLKCVAFDLEIAKQIPEGCEDWMSTQPGISCAATYDSDSQLHLFHGPLVNGRYADRMTKGEILAMLVFLIDMLNAGFVPVTWNGAGFDFRIVAQACTTTFELEMLKRLVLSHVDLAFAMFAAKGFMISLDTAAKGLGLPGKLEGMDGAKAPILWGADLRDQEGVLQYVGQDSMATHAVYEGVMAMGSLPWISRSGRHNVWQLPQGKSLTVQSVMAWPEPDTSWMNNPWPRSKFVGWLEE